MIDDELYGRVDLETSQSHFCGSQGDGHMSVKVYVPCDAAALSMGADAVAEAIENSGQDVTIVSQRIARHALAGTPGRS